MGESPKPDFEKTLALLRAETEHAWVEEERERKRSIVVWTLGIVLAIGAVIWWFTTTQMYAHLLDLAFSEERDWSGQTAGWALPGSENVSPLSVAPTVDGYFVAGTFTGGYGTGALGVAHTPTPIPSPPPGAPWSAPMTGSTNCGFLTRIRDGKVAWHVHLHADSIFRMPSVAAAADGGAYVVGTYDGGSLRPAEGATPLPLHPSMKETTMLARYSPDGELQWARHYGPASGIAVGTIGADAVVFGSNDNQAFLRRIDPDGETVWSRDLPSTSRVNLGYDQGFGTLAAVAVDGDDNIYVAGSVTGSIDFGDGRMTGAPGESAAFVVSYTAAGTLRWARRYGGESESATATIDELAVGEDGTLYVMGSFDVAIDFGCGRMRAPDYAYNVWLTRFDPQGNCRWSRLHTDVGSNADLAVASDGRVVVSIGYYYSGYSGWNSTLVKYGDTGRMAWRRAMPEYTSTEPGAVAVDGAGNVVVVGSYNGTLLLGGHEVNNTSAGFDGYLVVFDDP